MSSTVPTTSNTLDANRCCFANPQEHAHARDELLRRHRKLIARATARVTGRELPPDDDDNHDGFW